MKHTPGPWTASGSHVWKADPRLEGLGDLIATMSSNREEKEDNARLIAAAPDLLYALQMICDCGVALAEPIEEAMLAALAKAEGKK